MYESQAKCADGSRHDFCFYKATYSHDGKTADGLVGVMLDVTERKLMEEQLKISAQQQKALLDSIPDMAWMKDIEGRFIAVNQPFAQAAGMTPDTIQGKTDIDIWPRDLAIQYRNDDRGVIQEQTIKRIEEPITMQDGSSCWMETIKIPIFNEHHTVIGTCGIARDITERKNAEKERSHMEMQLQHARKMESIGQLAAGIAHEINTPAQFVGDNSSLS